MKTSEKIVMAIVEDISSRSGIGDGFDMIDKYTKEEILKTWVEIVEKTLNP